MTVRAAHRTKSTVAIVAMMFIVASALPAIGGVAHWLLLWNDQAYGDVDYYVASDSAAPFNTATARTEMASGRLTWNNVSSPPELIDYGGTKSMAGVACGTYTGVPSGGWVYIKGCSITGKGFTWYTTGFTGGKEYVIKALIGMDTTPSGYTWHISSSTTVPAGKADLRGAVAHELGHVHGAQHVPIDCGTLAAQTMCGDHELGTAAYRSAQSHEIGDWKARDALQ